MVLQVVGLKGPKMEAAAVKDFLVAVENFLEKEYRYKTSGVSATLPDLFGYATYLIDVTDLDEETIEVVGTTVCSAVIGKWTTFKEERVFGKVWKSATQDEVIL